MTKNSPLNCKTYKVGTLVYTRAALINVVFWMLWGDFWFQIMENLPNLITLQLKWQGASDRVIGLLGGSLPSIVFITMAPVIALQSDRHRGPLGRRRPFLLWCTPMVTVCLILLGFSETIGQSLHTMIGAYFVGMSQATINIVLIGIFCSMFFFFNAYVWQVYEFLFVDVIPQELMGRFIGLYRAVGAIGAFMFNRWVLGYAEGYAWAIYTGGALLYGTAFMFLVWQVKEGEYPPPDLTAKHAGFVNNFKLYAKECFTIPFYLKFYSIALFFWFAIVPFTMFIVFYATTTKNTAGIATLGLSLDEFGKIKGWTCMLQVPVFFLAGPVVDRFHPLRIVIAGLLCLCVTFLFGFVIVYNGTTLLIWWLINGIGMAMYLCAYLTLLPRLLPPSKFGQYCSANQMFYFSGLILAPILCGWFLDTVKDYRFLFIWSGSFTMLGLIMAISVYRHWKRLGGDKGYVPPEYS